uniref:Metaxin 3 n=1 Tax=Nomascus leucogenys TaxID=61853 RepID=A0A2I3H318_NOMLE
MAAPLELSCWGGGWGLPSVHSESLVVMAYAKFSGAPLKVNVIDNTWRGSRGDVPILTTEDDMVSQPAKILNFLRKQKYNADYELSAKQGADTLAYIALLEEKLLPAVPSTLDAYVFGFLAPLYKVRFPKVQLQEHLKQLSNLCRFCDDILSSYFRLSLGDG